MSQKLNKVVNKAVFLDVFSVKFDCTVFGSNG